MKNLLGYTLIELLVVISIIAILSLVALPSLSQQIKQNRLITNINNLHSTYKFVRSESAKREIAMTLIASGNEWTSSLNNETLIKFIPSHSSINISNLANQIINASGDTNSGDYLVTDGDEETTDYRLCIYVSGQSYISTEACS